MKKEAGRPPLGIEGLETGWWVLLDFADVVVHVFQDDARQYYSIDQTWADAPLIEASEAA
jgi:ribosome-associated protein